MSGLVIVTANGRGQVHVAYEDRGDYRELGVVKHNVVGIGAIKWSAYDKLGQRLDGVYTHREDAVKALVDTR